MGAGTCERVFFAFSCTIAGLKSKNFVSVPHDRALGMFSGSCALFMRESRG
jgi:hypothetical protein